MSRHQASGPLREFQKLAQSRPMIDSVFRHSAGSTGFGQADFLQLVAAERLAPATFCIWGPANPVVSCNPGGSRPTWAHTGGSVPAPGVGREDRPGRRRLAVDQPELAWVAVVGEGTLAPAEQQRVD